MHVPNRRMDCWTGALKSRAWFWDERHGRRPVTDHALECRAFVDEAERKKINGDTCNGCARIKGNKDGA